MFADFLSHEWVIADFPPENKNGAYHLVNLIFPQMQNRLSEVSWLDNTTRSAAMVKLANMIQNVGYDSNWIEYSGLAISSHQALMNYANINLFSNQRNFATVGTAPNRAQMPTNNYMQQNAFYSPTSNSINLIAGLILAPMFDASLPDLFNLATYGMVVGHEITHGFDNSGRLFNGSGAYLNWWTNTSEIEFDQRATCLVNQYNTFQVFGRNVSGISTLGENIADLGGLNLAFSAYKNAPPPSQLVSAFTNDQLFFLSFAQNWCTKNSQADAYNRLANDVHSPNKWRVNGPLSNMPSFADAYNCPASSFMGRSKTPARCEVW